MPLKLLDNFGTEHDRQWDRQCQLKRHGDKFSWDHKNILEGDHQTGQYSSKHTHSSDSGKRGIPSHKRRPTINSVSGIAKARETWETSFSHPLLAPDEQQRAVRQWMFEEARSLSCWC